MRPDRLFSLSSAFLIAAALTGAAVSGHAPQAPAAGSTPSPGQPAPPAAGAPAPGANPGPAGAPAGPTGPTGPGPAGPGSPGRRIEITGADGKPYPYTIELPAGWQLTPGKGIEGVFLAPAGVTAPESDPRAIYVRISPASLADPDKVVANIKQSDAADPTWTAPLVEVRQVGGVRGVLVRMDTGSGDQARSTLVLKMPLGMTSLDFMASAPRAEFDRQLPAYERVIFSVQPVR